MAITASAIGALVGRYNNKVVVPQALLNFPALEQGAIEKLERPTERGTINVKAGGLDATGLLADAGTLPAGTNVDITQLNYDGVYLFTRLKIPRGGATISKDPADGVNVVMEQMKTAGRDLGRTLGRLWYRSNLGTHGTASLAGTTVTVTDAAAYRIGMTVEVRNSGGSQTQTFVVQAIARTAGGAGGTLTATSGFTAAIAADDTFHIKGSVDNSFVSLDDAADSTSSLYGQAATALEWAGNEDASTTTLTPEALKKVLVDVQRRGGEKPSHMLLNSLNEMRLYNQMDDEIRYTGSKIDQYGKTMTFNGIEYIVDENVPDTHIFFHQKRVAKLHVFRDFAPDFDGAKKPGMSLASALVSDATLTYDVQLWGSFQGRFEERRCLGKMSALTA